MYRFGKEETENVRKIVPALCGCRDHHCRVKCNREWKDRANSPKRESEKDCLRREIKEELPKLKLGRIRLWKEVNGTNRHSGRKMSDAIFIVNKVSGDLTIGDKHEIDKATWRKPRGTRLTPTSRYIKDMLFPKR